MADIYSRARNVFIWLGDTRDDSDIAMDFVTKILEDFVTNDVSFPGNSTVRQWSACLSLIQREWFGRRWVIQELALSRTPLLICGDRAVHWADFMVALEYFIDSFDTISTFYRDPAIRAKFTSVGDIRALSARQMVIVAKDLVRDQDSGHCERLKSLESLVAELNLFHTGDPRDMIYALLSLANDSTNQPANPVRRGKPCLEESLILHADYSKTALDVFKDFTAFCIQSSGSLNIVCRKWASNSQTKKLSVTEQHLYKGRCPPTEEVHLPTWIGLLKDSAFGEGSRIRVAGDSLVGTPDGKLYNASGTESAQVLFGEHDLDSKAGIYISRDADLSLCYSHTTSGAKRNGRSRNFSQHPSRYKVTAQETLKKGRNRCSDGTLYARGVRVGQPIERISHQLYEGLLPAEWLAMAGFNDVSAEHVQDEIPEQLWRTLVADRGPNGQSPPWWYWNAMDWAFAHRDANGDIVTNELIRASGHSRLVPFLKRVQDVTWNRRLFLLPLETSDNLLGLAPPDAQEGDIVCVLLGCDVPVVLRQIDMADVRCGFEFIGEAFVYRIMEGEALRDYTHLDADAFRAYTEEFCLV